jgi:molybdopterin-guanine dinucleotide biosynthesis protein A
MGLIGIVACGGESSRMGIDKSTLIYYSKPQYEHVGDLISECCEQVVISCNNSQFGRLDTQYEKLPDLPEFSSSGPIAGLLTAFYTFPDKNFLLIGCDYPLLQKSDLALFLNAIQENSTAAAFYNKYGKYEPMLGWYSASAAQKLNEHFYKNDYSLQSFLHNVNAQKYIPGSEEVMKSVDTQEDFTRITDFIKERNG